MLNTPSNACAVTTLNSIQIINIRLQFYLLQLVSVSIILLPISIEPNTRLLISTTFKM